MIIRWTSFILLIYILWNHNKYDIIALEDNRLSIMITKIIHTFPLTFFGIIILLCGIIFLLYSVKGSFRITSYIISITIIIIVITLMLNIIALKEYTDIIIFQINHPLSGQQKINYFKEYLSEIANIYGQNLTDSDRQYFVNCLMESCKKISDNDLIKMNLEEIENYCHQLMEEASLKTSYRHDKLSYILVACYTIYFLAREIIIYLYPIG